MSFGKLISCLASAHLSPKVDRSIPGRDRRKEDHGTISVLVLLGIRRTQVERTDETR